MLEEKETLLRHQFGLRKASSLGNVVYPPPDWGLMLGLATLTAVTIILIMGISLVPALLPEEKQTQMVSPASISQVVMGKALTGLFCVLVTAGVVFGVYWTGMVHWAPAILFVVGVGLFAVALGLVLGSFFERQQEVAGWSMLLVVVFIGAMFVDMVGLQTPALIPVIIPWVPSGALAEVFRFAFSEQVAWVPVWANLGNVVGISALLYAGVVWKVRRSGLIRFREERRRNCRRLRLVGDLRLIFVQYILCLAACSLTPSSGPLPHSFLYPHHVGWTEARQR